MAVNLLLIEAALGSRRRLTRRAALAMPLLLVGLAAWHPAITFWQREFLSQFTALMRGEPMFVTLCAAMALYAVAAARGLPGALDCLALCTGALAVLRPTAAWDDLAQPDALPVAASAVLVLLPAFRRRSLARCFTASCLLLTSLMIANRDTWISEGYGVVPWHLLLAMILITGSFPNDRFAKAIQELGALMLASAALAWAQWNATGDKAAAELSIGSLLFWAYPLATAFLATVYGRYTNNRRYFAAAAVELIVWGSVVGPRCYLLARQQLAGFNYLLLGALSFLLAAVTSLFKTGWPQRWRARHRTMPAGVLRDQ